MPCVGGGSQDGNPSHPPSPKMQNLPQNRRNLAEPPVPHVAEVPEVTKMSPECRQNVAKGSHVTSAGAGGEVANFPPIL
jgi:hypothetical protein